MVNIIINDRKNRGQRLMFETQNSGNKRTHDRSRQFRRT